MDILKFKPKLKKNLYLHFFELEIAKILRKMNILQASREEKNDDLRIKE